MSVKMYGERPMVLDHDMMVTVHWSKERGMWENEGSKAQRWLKDYCYMQVRVFTTVGRPKLIFNGPLDGWDTAANMRHLKKYLNERIKAKQA